ncbi:hypothetical protein B0H17DRAFT_1223358 [Mycena rosella]|uniref:CCHC-type domain-containing protein n=1 Tax=Mycena rosella TaxID=1033263 RepID=A0AAD7MC45_MYCRO|nr:hypothetical protein B0H17DRAFT_1223358 [Mycena rosella]
MPEPWDRNKPTFDSDDHEELLTFVDHISQTFTKPNITDETQKKKKKYWCSLAIYGTGTYDKFLEEVFKSCPGVKMEEIGSVESLKTICKRYKGVKVSDKGKLRHFGVEFHTIAKKLMSGQALTTNLQGCQMYLDTLDEVFSSILKFTASSAKLMRSQLAPLLVVPPMVVGQVAPAPSRKGDPIELLDLIKMAEDMAAPQPEGDSIATTFPTIKQEPRDERIEELGGALATLRDVFLVSQKTATSQHAEVLKTLQQVAKGPPPHREIEQRTAPMNDNSGSNNSERWNNPARAMDGGDCYYCEETGHFARNCPHKEAHINKGRQVEEYWRSKTSEQQMYVQQFAQPPIQMSYYQSEDSEKHLDFTETAMDEIRTLKVKLAKAEQVNNQNAQTIANSVKVVQPTFMASAQPGLSSPQGVDINQALQALLLWGIQSVNDQQGYQDQMGAKTRSKPAKPPEDHSEASSEKSRNWRTKATKGSDNEQSEDEEEGLPEITKERNLKVAAVVEDNDISGDAVARVPYRDLPPINHQRTNQNGNTDQDVDQVQYPISLGEKAYRVRAPVQKEGISARLTELILNTEVPVKIGELYGVATEVRDQAKTKLTKVRVLIPTRTVDLASVLEPEAKMAFEREEVEELEYDALLISQLPQDPYTQYLESLSDNERPRQVVVAGDSASLRAIYPLVNKKLVVECVTDSGSQIVSMSYEQAKELQLVWDPDIQIFMQSANSSLEKSVGLAKNVLFKFGKITVYLQVHIIRGAAYKVLLGRTFEILTESTVQNHPDGSQTLTMKDPNTGKHCMMPTHPRGKPSHSSGSRKATVESVPDEEEREERTADSEPHERGELALKFGFSQSNELEIQGYFQPRKGQFTETELQEAYISASADCQEIKEDKVASTLFQEFRAGVKKPRKHRRTQKYNVFTWNVKGQADVVPDQSKAYHGLKAGEAVRTTHVFNQEIRCPCCQTADFITPEEGTSKEDPLAKAKERSKTKAGARAEAEAREEVYHVATEPAAKEPISVFAAKKYKPVGLKVRPVYTELPERQSLDFDEFKEEIDTRGGYYQSMKGVASSVDEFDQDPAIAIEQEQVFTTIVKAAYAAEDMVIPQFMVLSTPEEEGFFRTLNYGTTRIRESRTLKIIGPRWEKSG